MKNILFYDLHNRPEPQQLDHIVDFLHLHLGQYGDPAAQIAQAAAYALGNPDTQGGFIATLYEAEKLIGAAIINRTGMASYIPDNILVYIAIHDHHRGVGAGRLLLTETISHARGAIALHVEPGNPAIKLYERFGFTNKYLEMRLEQRKS